MFVFFSKILVGCKLTLCDIFSWLNGTDVGTITMEVFSFLKFQFLMFGLYLWKIVIKSSSVILYKRFYWWLGLQLSHRLVLYPNLRIKMICLLHPKLNHLHPHSLQQTGLFEFHFLSDWKAYNFDIFITAYFHTTNYSKKLMFLHLLNCPTNTIRGNKDIITSTL